MDVTNLHKATREPQPRDWRDGVISEQADRIGGLESDVVTLTDVLRRMMTALHDVTIERDILRAQRRIDRRREECESVEQREAA